MKYLTLLLSLALTACNAPPVTDAQVQVVAAQCKDKGMVTKVFNGVTSFVECVSTK